MNKRRRYKAKARRRDLKILRDRWREHLNMLLTRAMPGVDEGE